MLWILKERETERERAIKPREKRSENILHKYMYGWVSMKGTAFFWGLQIIKKKTAGTEFMQGKTAYAPSDKNKKKYSVCEQSHFIHKYDAQQHRWDRTLCFSSCFATAFAPLFVCAEITGNLNNGWFTKGMCVRIITVLDDKYSQFSMDTCGINMHFCAIRSNKKWEWNEWKLESNQFWTNEQN